MPKAGALGIGQTGVSWSASTVATQRRKTPMSSGRSIVHAPESSPSGSATSPSSRISPVGSCCRKRARGTPVAFARSVPSALARRRRSMATLSPPMKSSGRRTPATRPGRFSQRSGGSLHQSLPSTSWGRWRSLPRGWRRVSWGRRRRSPRGGCGRSGPCRNWIAPFWSASRATRTTRWRPGAALARAGRRSGRIGRG